jgi:hypothetical protein
VSRSDDSGMLGVIPKRVVPLGFSVCSPHFNAGLPTTHIDSLVQLAAALTWLAVAFRGYLAPAFTSRFDKPGQCRHLNRQRSPLSAF